MRIPGLLAIATLILTGCSSLEDSKKPIIATSIYPLEFLASSIAGEHFDVINLTPPGTEPHDFELSIGAMKTISEAKAIFVNGYGMEAYDLASHDYPYYQKTVVVGEVAEPSYFNNVIDPHFWLSTLNYRKMAECVFNTILSLDKEHESIYKTNFDKLLSRFDDLESKCQSIASSFSNKIIAVTHHAYGYMGLQWGFSQIAVNGLSPEEEPSQQAIENMLDTIASRGIDTIFFEELASDEVASAIARQTGIKTSSLATLEYLSEEDRDEGKDYFSLYSENIEKIEKTKP